ncbi:MAG: 4Fe-4S dicluster domain-containing protein [Nitrososphaerota archaeon]|nr:4Fe-4S dicluster domain-containing protein [Candidatus Bathyarchaeota archaeon]MDW8023936.1 4Fe-4S dicluster domain-containing protein [Nitrososphaerota archaeon]
MAEEKLEKAASFDFSKEITSRLGGETITFCYQCGTCASSCPVAKTTDRFNPREVIRLALLGQRGEVLTGGAIWLCASCYTCQERCPQKVEIADVIYALRNIAISEGQVPKIYAEFANVLMNEGRIVPMSKFLEKKRAEYGLPTLKPAGVEALKKILSATGFDKITAKKGEQQ